MYREQTLSDDRAISIFLLLLGALAVLAAAAYGVVSNRQSHTIIAAGNYGAIAISATTLDLGSAWGYGDAPSAAHRALSECNAHGARCVLRLSLSGNCGAMAVSRIRGESFATTDSDKTLAGALALAQCQAGGAGDCVLRQSFCGDGS